MAKDAIFKKEGEDDADGQNQAHDTATPRSLQDPQPPSTKPYTVFTRTERWLITIIMGVAMFFSPMTANIYFPAMPVLADAMGVSSQKINLTVTAYIVLQGISPLFIGDLADKIGRRPVYLLTFAIYIVASLGLALNRRSYTVLLVLRTLQSAGCSATAAISYGVLADVAPPAKRGRMLGAAMVAANTGPTVGPVLGGVIVDRVSWNWLFWMLVILGSGFMVTLFVAFPETSRRAVDNGALAAPVWNRPVLSFVLRYPKNASRNPKSSSRAKRTSLLSIPNPWPAIRVAFYRDAALVLWVSAAHYMAYYCLQATMPALYTDVYGLSGLQVGLTYIAIGLGVALGGFSNGKFLDLNYRRTAKKDGFTINTIAGDDLRCFQIEKARTRFAYVLIILDTCLLIAYGWACQRRAHIAVALILQFSLGFLQTCIVQTFNTLLVDIFPANPSTASASGNVTRCALSAAGIAVVQPMLDQLDYGMVFTIIGCFVGVTAIAASFFIRSCGMKWRLQRLGYSSGQEASSKSTGGSSKL